MNEHGRQSIRHCLQYYKELEQNKDAEIDSHLNGKAFGQENQGPRFTHSTAAIINNKNNDDDDVDEDDD